ncbi:hypothetical protein AgCh_020347 [Apium graveolens]
MKIGGEICGIDSRSVMDAYCFFYLVESKTGEMLMIKRMFGRRSYTTISFCIFKLKYWSDTVNGHSNYYYWDETSSLPGKEALLLGWNDCSSISMDEHNAYKSNCIYFYDEDMFGKVVAYGISVSDFEDCERMKGINLKEAANDDKSHSNARHGQTTIILLILALQKRQYQELLQFALDYWPRGFHARTDFRKNFRFFYKDNSLPPSGDSKDRGRVEGEEEAINVDGSDTSTAGPKAKEVDLLEQVFCMEELEFALKSFSNDKAPGPDGINMRYIKEFWVYLKDKILEGFIFFAELGVLPRGCN